RRGGEAARRARRRGDPVQRAAPRARAGADRPRDRGPPADLGRPREPRDRRPPLPLGGDGQVARTAPAREAPGTLSRPRGRGGLQAQPDRLSEAPRLELRQNPVRSTWLSTSLWKSLNRVMWATWGKQMLRAVGTSRYQSLALPATAATEPNTTKRLRIRDRIFSSLGG